MNGVNIALGYALASYMGLAFYYVGYGDTQWRAPLGIALAWPVLMIVVIWIAPESPRWLLMKGQVDQAKQVTFKLHTIRGDVRTPGDTHPIPFSLPSRHVSVAYSVYRPKCLIWVIHARPPTPVDCPAFFSLLSDDICLKLTQLYSRTKNLLGVSSTR